MMSDVSLFATPPEQWKPIGDGAIKSRVWDVLRALGPILNEDYQKIEHFGLSEGRLGLDLYRLYLYRETHDEAILERVRDGWETARAEVTTKHLNATLFTGFPGFGWFTEHASYDLGLDSKEYSDTLVQALVNYLETIAQKNLQSPFDQMYGLAGIGTYGLELSCPGRPSPLLSHVLRNLQRLALPTEQGLAWRTEPKFLPSTKRWETPGGQFNLGMAHGAPGVLCLLAAAFEHRLEGPDLREAIRWLMAHENPPGSPSAFPAVIGADSSTPRTLVSRVAWCHGDLGASFALLDAARCLTDTSLYKQGLQIALNASRRTSVESGVVDASLCHGSAGNAHLFNCLYQRTGHEELRTTALHWLSKALDGFAPNVGYTMWNPDIGGIENPYIWRPGFLDGIAGIALCLLATVSPVPPRWSTLLGIHRL